MLTLHSAFAFKTVLKTYWLSIFVKTSTYISTSLTAFTCTHVLNNPKFSLCLNKDTRIQVNVSIYLYTCNLRNSATCAIFVAETWYYQRSRHVSPISYASITINTLRELLTQRHTRHFALKYLIRVLLPSSLNSLFVFACLQDACGHLELMPLRFERFNIWIIFWMEPLAPFLFLC